MKRGLGIVLGIVFVTLMAGGASAQLTVSIDQSHIQNIVLKNGKATSTLVVPFTVTGVVGQLSNADLKVFDGNGNVYGAPKDCDKIYRDTTGDGTIDSEAEARYVVQRVDWTPPYAAIRVYFVFDSSASITGGDDSQLQYMKTRATLLAQKLLALESQYPGLDVRITAGSFAGSIREMEDFTLPPGLNPPDSLPEKWVNDPVAASNMIDTMVDYIKRRGAATNLTYAVERAKNQLENAPRDPNPCEPNPCAPQQTLKILVTFSDLTHNATASFPDQQTWLTNLVSQPDWMFVNFWMWGEHVNSAISKGSLLGDDLQVSASNGKVINSTNPSEVGQPYNDSIFMTHVNDAWSALYPDCPQQYLLYLCTAWRSGVHNLSLTVNYGGASATDSAPFQAPSGDYCVLYEFDSDADCHIRNFGDPYDYNHDGVIDEFESSNGFDAWTVAMNLLSGFLPPPNECSKWQISPKDSDISGCMDASAWACNVPVNCTVEDCKFGKECDQDGDDTNLMTQLVVDTCRQIHPEFSSPESTVYATPKDIIDATGKYDMAVQDPEPAENGIPNTCRPANPKSSRYYCENGIDEDGDGIDAECPEPPAPKGCELNEEFAPADHTLDEVLQTGVNVLVIPDVREGTIPGVSGSWKTDVNLLAKGPAPVDVFHLSVCNYHLDCLQGDDGFYHAVKCPTPYDVTGDHVDDACGFCFVPKPWVEMFFIPAKDANAGSPGGPVVSRKFCLDSNGAIHISDILAQFPGLSNVSGTLVVASNRELVEAHKTLNISSRRCSSHPSECPAVHVVNDSDTIVDAAARTYNEDGYGKRVPAVPMEQVFGSNKIAHFYHLTGPDKGQYNIDFGIVNLTQDDDVTFEVRFNHPDGTPISINHWNVAAGSVAWKTNALPLSKSDYDVYATVQVVEPKGSERWYAWASVTETVTSDAFAVESGPTITDQTGKLYLPDASRDVITPDMQYHLTDAEVANVEPRPDAGNPLNPAKITFWVAGNESTTKTVRMIMPESAYRLVDVLTDLGMTDNVNNKTMVIQVDSSEGEIAAYNHTYTLKITAGSANSSTYGEGVGALTDNDLFGMGRSVAIPCFGGTKYDTTVYVVNPTSEDVTVNVEFWGAKGWRFGSAPTMGVTVAAGQTLAVNVPEDRKASTATVTVKDGNGKIFAYAKVTDQATGDDTVLIAR